MSEASKFSVLCSLSFRYKYSIFSETRETRVYIYKSTFSGETSTRRSVISHNWFLNNKLWLSCSAVYYMDSDSNAVACFFVQNDRPAKWRWCQICHHCRKLWWSSYIETAAEMLPKDGSSKVAWQLRLCNVCLFFTWRSDTVKTEGLLTVVSRAELHRWSIGCLLTVV